MFAKQLIFISILILPINYSNGSFDLKSFEDKLGQWYSAASKLPVKVEAREITTREVCPYGEEVAIICWSMFNFVIIMYNGFLYLNHCEVSYTGYIKANGTSPAFYDSFIDDMIKSTAEPLELIVKNVRAIRDITAVYLESEGYDLDRLF